MNERISLVQTLLREYGEAVRGDWGEIDGRWVQRDLEAISYALDETEVPESLLTFRNRLDLCPSGEGHWSEHCNDGCNGQ